MYAGQGDSSQQERNSPIIALSMFTPNARSEPDLVPYKSERTLSARSVLVLAPHPDDEVFGCGGAIASHVQCGVKVCVIVLTDGALYGDAGVRMQESIDAAHVLGYGSPEFWHQPDRGLICSEGLVQRLLAKMAEVGADLVYAPSPWEVHPDHRQAYLLAVEAARKSASGVRLALYEVGAALRPNVLLDMTAQAEIKATAMLCFASQLTQQNYLLHMKALNQYRTYTLGPNVAMAEAFWLTTPGELGRHLSNTLEQFICQGTMTPDAIKASSAAKKSYALAAFQRLKSWLTKFMN